MPFAEGGQADRYAAKDQPREAGKGLDFRAGRRSRRERREEPPAGAGRRGRGREEDARVKRARWEVSKMIELRTVALVLCLVTGAIQIYRDEFDSTNGLLMFIALGVWWK